MYGEGAGDQQARGCSGPKDTDGQARSHTHSHALPAPKGWHSGHASPGPGVCVSHSPHPA